MWHVSFTKDWSMELEKEAMFLTAGCTDNDRWDAELEDFPSIGFSRINITGGTFFSTNFSLYIAGYISGVGRNLRQKCVRSFFFLIHSADFYAQA